jgi:hypothetical protein
MRPKNLIRGNEQIVRPGAAEHWEAEKDLTRQVTKLGSLED